MQIRCELICHVYLLLSYAGLARPHLTGGIPAFVSCVWNAGVLPILTLYVEWHFLSMGRAVWLPGLIKIKIVGEIFGVAGGIDAQVPKGLVSK